MKARILNKEVSISEERFKVLSMNYDFVIIELDGDKKILKTQDVELIPENNYEDIFTEYKDVLKIKLDKGISLNFYSVLISYIEDIIEERVKQIEVLEDNYDLIKKGIWEKKLLLVVNCKKALKISIIGEKYGKRLSFTIKEFRLSEFADYCDMKVHSLQNEIDEKVILKNKYKKSLKDIINNAISNKKPILLKS